MSFVTKLIYNLWDMLMTTGYWLVFSLFIAGILHNFLSPDILQKNLGNTKFSSILKATVSGMLLPVCSCGVVPLGISLYYSGVYLGPTLAFMIATPIVNPASALLSYAFLGKDVTIIYIFAGITIALVSGIVGNMLAGERLFIPQTNNKKIEIVKKKQPFHVKILTGIKWGFTSLGKEVGIYVFPGIVLAAVILTIIPNSFIQSYLSKPNLLSIIGIAIVATVMHVCNMGHLPFIATIVASGATPGVAVTFLIVGVGTNIPELVSTAKLIGKKIIVVYTSIIIALGIGFGYLTNYLLLPGFKPIFDITMNEGFISMANSLEFDPPEIIKVISAVAIVCFFLMNYKDKIIDLFRVKKTV